MLFVDSDVEFEPESVVRMLVAKKRIICTPYRVKAEQLDKHIYTVEFKDPKTIPILPGGLVELEAGPTGLMLIDRGVFERIIKNHPELYSNNVKEIIKDFISATIDDLYNSLEEAQQSVLTPEIMLKYIEGKLGYNELLENTVRLFNKFDDSRDLMFNAAKGTLKEKDLFTSEIENYLVELERFVSIRKNDPLVDIGSVKSSTFNYDFEAIRENEYQINPNSTPLLKTPLRFDFFHDQEQQKYISNQVKMYSAQAEGMGRLLFQSDSRLLFRSFSKS